MSDRPVDVSAASARDREVVLLVEDEKLLRALMSRTLQEYGYTVIEAPDGQEALEACEQSSRRIDVVITDVVMPRMSGPEFVARLASLRPDPKVIYMSGYTDKASILQGSPRVQGIYLHKPFGPDALLAKIREVLDSPRKTA